MADAIRHGVMLTPKQRRPAMQRLRSIVQRQDVFWWVQCFLSACGMAIKCKGATTAPKDVGAEKPEVLA